MNRRGTASGRPQPFAGNRDNAMNQSSVITWSPLVILVFFALGAGSSSVPPDLKALYDQKEYQKVVDGLSKLSQDAQASPEVRRLKVRTLVKPEHLKRRLRNMTSSRRTTSRRCPAAARSGFWVYSGAGEGYAGANAWGRLYGAEGNRFRRNSAVFRRRVERWFRTGEGIGCRRVGTIRKRPQVEKVARRAGRSGGHCQSAGGKGARKERRPVRASADRTGCEG